MLLFSGVVIICGCTRLHPFGKLPLDKEKNEDKQSPFGRATLVRDYASPANMTLAEIVGFSLVWNLRGTGSEEPPGTDRELVLRELQKQNFDSPNALIDSKNTAIVRVQGILPPGIQAGDRFDVKIGVRPGSEVQSLQGGLLIRTALRETGQVGNTVKTDFAVAEAEGAILLSPTADGKDNPMALLSGKILGGGIAKKSRPLYLMMKEQHVSEIITDRIANRINERFYIKDGAKTKGVATAKTDTRIDLVVHPIYKDNVDRYMQVLLSVSCYETQMQRTKRIAELKENLLIPEKSQDAALQLEAIGKAGIEPLKGGLQSESTEVRFYAAEALAYMGVYQAARPLAEIARTEQAFRVRALSALSVMQSDLEAETCLRELLNESSAETRYGAFRALWYRNPNDLAIRGETLGKDESYRFAYHVLETSGPPMIHVTYAKRPEIVLFNSDIRMSPNFIIDAGISILVRSTGPDEVVVSRLNPSGMDERRTVTMQLDEVIRAISELYGTYPDVVQFLQEAANQRALPCRLEVDRLPQGGRIYTRPSESYAEEERKKTFWERLRPGSKKTENTAEEDSAEEL